MKKVILSAFILSASFACQKADVENSTLSSNDVAMSPTKTNNGEGLRNSVKHVVGPITTVECMPHPGVCFGDKHLAPNHVEVIRKFTDPGADLIDLFIQYEAVVGVYVSPQTVVDVITGALTVEVFGNVDDIAHFVFSKAGTEVKVIPVKK